MKLVENSRNVVAKEKMLVADIGPEESRVPQSVRNLDWGKMEHIIYREMHCI